MLQEIVCGVLASLGLVAVFWFCALWASGAFADPCPKCWKRPTITLAEDFWGWTRYTVTCLRCCKRYVSDRNWPAGGESWPTKPIDYDKEMPSTESDVSFTAEGGLKRNQRGGDMFTHTDFVLDYSTDQIPGKYVLSILDADGEEVATIIHRATSLFPIDGDLANEKRQRAARIVNALNYHNNLLTALRMYEAAFEDLFVHCCSNPVKNAWGKPVDMTLLNKAHEFAGTALAGITD